MWILALENLLRFTAPRIDTVGTAEKFMPGADAGSLVAALGGATSSATGVAAVVDGTRALWSVVLYTVVFAVVGAVTLKGRDVQ